MVFSVVFGKSSELIRYNNLKENRTVAMGCTRLTVPTTAKERQVRAFMASLEMLKRLMNFLGKVKHRRLYTEE